MQITPEELTAIANKILGRLNDLKDLLTVVNVTESNKRHLVKFATDGGIFYGALVGALEAKTALPESMVLSAEQWLHLMDNLFDTMAGKLDDE